MLDIATISQHIVYKQRNCRLGKFPNLEPAARRPATRPRLGNPTVWEFLLSLVAEYAVLLFGYNL